MSYTSFFWRVFNHVQHVLMTLWEGSNRQSLKACLTFLFAYEQEMLSNKFVMPGSLGETMLFFSSFIPIQLFRKGFHNLLTNSLHLSFKQAITVLPTLTLLFISCIQAAFWLKNFAHTESYYVEFLTLLFLLMWYTWIP